MRILEDANNFDEVELYYFIEDVLDEALDNLAIRAASEVPGYDPDWTVSDTSDPRFKKFNQSLNNFISALYDFLITNK